MLIVTIQVNAPPGAAECVKEVLGMALEQLGDARVVSIMQAAAAALSALQAENEKLRAELEYEKEHANAYYEECGQWEAENTQLKEKLEALKQDKEKLPEQLKLDLE